MLADVCLSSVPVWSCRFSLTTHLLVLALCGAPSLDIAGYTFLQDLLLPPNTGTTLGVSYNVFSPRNPRNINANHPSLWFYWRKQPCISQRTCCNLTNGDIYLAWVAFPLILAFEIGCILCTTSARTHTYVNNIQQRNVDTNSRETACFQEICGSYSQK